MKKSDDKKVEPVKSTGASVAPKNSASRPVAAKRNAKATPKSVAKPKIKTAIESVKPTGKLGASNAKLAQKEKSNTSDKQKVKKQKLVRDSFTMPEAEYAVLGDVKKLCLKAGVDVKKSELLRIGVAHIRTLALADLKKAIASLVPLKAGRPKKEK